MFVVVVVIVDDDVVDVYVLVIGDGVVVVVIVAVDDVVVVDVVIVPEFVLPVPTPRRPRTPGHLVWGFSPSCNPTKFNCSFNHSSTKLTANDYENGYKLNKNIII